MLGNEAQAASVTVLLAPFHATNSGEATSSAYVAVPDGEGDVMFIANVGVVTAGSVAMKITHSATSNGASPADVTGGGFTTVTTANDPMVQKVVIARNALRAYVSFTGTVTTGPVDVSCLMVMRAKYAS